MYRAVKRFLVAYHAEKDELFIALIWDETDYMIDGVKQKVLICINEDGLPVCLPQKDAQEGKLFSIGYFN